MSKKRFLFIWCFVSAFLVLLFTSRSSFLFPCNNWDDANSYFTMGKGMMNGLVIYRDLYDQKGPFLYLLYGIAYLISNKSFFGVFIFEIIAASFFLYFASLAILRRSNTRITAILVPVLAAGVYSSWSFYWGGAAEEFCLPLFACSIYVLDRILDDEYSAKELTRKVAIVGVLSGIIAQIKYTMLGFFAAWFVIVMIYVLVKFGFVSALQNALKFVLFALIPSIPWMIYFVITGSLDDWFRCYIYNNIFFYSDISGESYSLFNKLYEVAKTLYWLIQDSISYFVFIILGFILQLVLEKKFIKKIYSLMLFGFTYLVIFIGGNKLPYYSIPLMPMAIPGMALLAEIISRIYKKNLFKAQRKVATPLTIAVATIVLVLSTFFASVNCLSSEYRKQDKDSFWLVEMSRLIDEDSTLLNVNALDVGLYTLTGIVPNCEYFQTNGIGLPTMFEEQAKYIKEARSEYVIASYYEPDGIYDNYELISTKKYNKSGFDQIFYLYKRLADE